MYEQTIAFIVATSIGLNKNHLQDVLHIYY